MERIKQALDRARAERGELTADAVVAEPNTPTQSAQDVEYTQTRHHEVTNDDLRKNRVVTSLDPGAFTDAFKMLRTQVLQRLKENDWNVLAITSPGSGAGKTLTSLNLAASLAMEVDYTVLLVDADLRHPRLHEHLGLPAGEGLSDYLLNDRPLSELLIHPKGIDHLTVLPGGRSLQNSAEMLNSPKMSQLVEETKARYTKRVVIFDLPPVLNSADAMAFSPYVDATLLVVEDNVSKRGEVQHAIELLSSTNLLGTVLNKG